MDSEPVIDDPYGLTGLRDEAAAPACQCTCHHRRFGQPVTALHEGGRACQCQLTPDERAVAAATFRSHLEELRAMGTWHPEEQDREGLEGLAASLGLSDLEVTGWLYPVAFTARRGNRTVDFRSRSGFELREHGQEGRQIAGDPVSVEEGVRLTAAILDGLDAQDRETI